MNAQFQGSITKTTTLLQDFITILSKYVPLPLLILDKDHFILKKNHIDVVNIYPECEDDYLSQLKAKVQDFVGEKMFKKLLEQIYIQIANSQRKQ